MLHYQNSVTYWNFIMLLEMNYITLSYFLDIAGILIHYITWIMLHNWMKLLPEFH